MKVYIYSKIVDMDIFIKYSAYIDLTIVFRNLFKLSSYIVVCTMYYAIMNNVFGVFGLLVP